MYEVRQRTASQRSSPYRDFWWIFAGLFYLEGPTAVLIYTPSIGQTKWWYKHLIFVFLNRQLERMHISRSSRVLREGWVEHKARIYLSYLKRAARIFFIVKACCAKNKWNTCIFLVLKAGARSISGIHVNFSFLKRVALRISVINACVFLVHKACWAKDDYSSTDCGSIIV